jgi:site-specific DNA-methyltransferase (adenine-specific)
MESQCRPQFFMRVGGWFHLMPTSRTFNGDCVEEMKKLPDNSVDSVVCDPPYGLSFMGREWDSFTDAQAMGEWSRRWALEALRVLKPGGHIIAFAGSRTYHRMAQGIEDAGFEIRDQIMWMYGSGFPKSLNVSKAIDKRGGIVADFEPFRDAVIDAMKEKGVTRKELTKALGNDMLSHYITKGSQPAVPKLEDYLIIKETLEMGDEWDELFLPEAEREVVGKGTSGIAAAFGDENLGSIEGLEAPEYDVTVAETDMAKKWEGWGTALKPAHEPCVLARKPFPSSVAENVLKHGTGAINIDASRVQTDDVIEFERKKAMWSSEAGQWRGNEEDTSVYEQHEGGRFPTNVLVSHHEECTEEECNDDCPRLTLDKQSGHTKSRKAPSGVGFNKSAVFGGGDEEFDTVRGHNDEGGASRFFYAPDLDTEFATEHEPAVVGRKPFSGTVAENVLKHGTGGINIDGARIGETVRNVEEGTGEKKSDNGSMAGHNTHRRVVGEVVGRFPTNVIVSHHPDCTPTGETVQTVRGGSGTGGSTRKDSVFETSGFKPNNDVDKVKASAEEVEIYDCHPDCPRLRLDKQSGTSAGSGKVKVSAGGQNRSASWESDGGMLAAGAVNVGVRDFGDAGGASRFFHDGELKERAGEWGPDFDGADRFIYCPKPTATERHSGGRVNIHPTVKPVDVMRYLCRLVTPKGGTVLDPFMGSGTTGVAAILEGFNFIGIELDPDYHELAEYRIKELTIGRPRNMGEWFN